MSWATPRPRPPSRVLADLNDKQQEAVTAPNGPVLVVAGPGSGKTRVITTRIAHLIESGRAKPRAIAAISFTRKSSEEMTTRLKAMLPAFSAGAVWTSTFHRLCGRLLREHGAAAGIRSDFRIADEVGQTNVMRQCMFDARIDIRLTKPNTIVKLMSIRKNRMLNPADPANWPNDENADRNAELCKAYQETLQQTNTLDFDDMLLRAVWALEENEEARQAAAKQLPILLVDEWQDTNLPQYLLVRMIAHDHRNLFVVGDPDQAIYGWRGAELRNILDFQRDFPETRRIDLDVAYRSTGRLLEAAQAMIRHNRERIEHTLKPAQEAGAFAGVWDAMDANDEAAFAVERARARITLDNGTIGVLYRTNAQSRGFETGFKRAGVPYSITGGKSFYDRPEVQDALCCLQAAVDPQEDDEAMQRFLGLPPHRQLGKKGTAKVDTFRGDTFWERAYRGMRSGTLPEWQVEVLGQRFALARLIARTARRENLETGFQTMLEQVGYLPALEKTGDEEAGERAENVWELLTDARVFREENGVGSEDPEGQLGTIRDFLEHCRSMRSPDEPGADTRVTLSTLHKSKGLEFDTVVIGGFDATRLPHEKSMTSDDRGEQTVFEEERRLAYVGMTRARTELYLSVPRVIGNRGRQRPTEPSPFLAEIPLELTEDAPGSARSETAEPEPERAEEEPAAPTEVARSDGMTMGPYGPELRLK